MGDENESLNVGMRKTLIVKRYHCEHCDYYIELRNFITNEVLVFGDYYHDHIDELINGFIQGMEFAGYYIIELETDMDFRCENCVYE